MRLADTVFMKAARVDATPRTWTVTMNPPPVPSTAASVPDRTRLPESPSASPAYGARTDAASSMLAARMGIPPEVAEDARLANRVLEAVIHLLVERGVPDRAAQDLLMAKAEEAGARAPVRMIDPRVLESEQRYESNSPLSADTRAWLLSVSPLSDTMSDLVQRLCIAKAHLAVDPLFARRLAASVTSATNLRAQFGASDPIRAGLGRLAFAIDNIDGIAAR